LDEFAFQNLERKFKMNIEKSSSLHLEFWSLLSEENPGKIEKISLNI